MKALDVLKNYRAARAGAKPRHWFDDNSKADDLTPRKCSAKVPRPVLDHFGQPKRNRKGEVVKQEARCRHLAVPGFDVCLQHGAKKTMAPIRGGGHAPDPFRLQQLLADVDRYIDGLPVNFRAMLHHLYRAPLPLREDQVPGEWTDANERERQQQIMHQLGYRQPQEFWIKHDQLVAGMEIRLADWFGWPIVVVHTPAPVDPETEEALNELEAELAGAA